MKVLQIHWCEYNTSKGSVTFRFAVITLFRSFVVVVLSQIFNSVNKAYCAVKQGTVLLAVADPGWGI